MRELYSVRTNKQKRKKREREREREREVKRRKICIKEGN
jgi:hypothetical protein